MLPLGPLLKCKWACLASVLPVFGLSFEKYFPESCVQARRKRIYHRDSELGQKAVSIEVQQLQVMAVILKGEWRHGKTWN